MIEIFIYYIPKWCLETEIVGHEVTEKLIDHYFFKVLVRNVVIRRADLGDILIFTLCSRMVAIKTELAGRKMTVKLIDHYFFLAILM